MPGIGIAISPHFKNNNFSFARYCTPQNVYATAVSDTDVILTWDSCDQADSYKVYYGTDGITFGSSSAAASNIHTISGLSGATPYYFYVVSIKDAEESNASDIKTATTFTAYYVRPSGGDYGDEDGSSYANAWDGFADISWASLGAGKVLYICGTHNERYNVAASGTSDAHFVIRGDYSGDAGILDGLDTVTHLLFISGCDYTETHKLTITQAVTTCYEAGQGHHWVYDCDITDSGDQNIECRNSAVLRIYRTNITGAGDDGISMHLGGIIYVDDCLFDNNVQDHIGSAGGAGITVTNSSFGEAPYGINTDCITNISRCSFVMSGSILANGSNATLSTLSYCLLDVTGFVWGENMFDAINLLVDNCTFIGVNTAGTVSRVGYKQKFRNCIFYDIGRIFYWFAGATDADHETINCNFYSLGSKDLRANTGEISGDPKFTNLAGGDFTLASDSPCRGVGITGLGYTTDYAGNPVPATGVDVGCYQNS